MRIQFFATLLATAVALTGCQKELIITIPHFPQQKLKREVSPPPYMSSDYADLWWLAVKNRDIAAVKAAIKAAGFTSELTGAEVKRFALSKGLFMANSGFYSVYKVHDDGTYKIMTRPYRSLNRTARAYPGIWKVIDGVFHLSGGQKTKMYYQILIFYDIRLNKYAVLDISIHGASPKSTTVTVFDSTLSRQVQNGVLND